MSCCYDGCENIIIINCNVINNYIPLILLFTQGRGVNIGEVREMCMQILKGENSSAHEKKSVQLKKNCDSTKNIFSILSILPYFLHYLIELREI